MATNDVSELKNILVDFIGEQRKFNDEQRTFNSEQREFNKWIDKKIDKVQYYLEETMAEHVKTFFEENMVLKSKIEELNVEVFDIKNELMELSSQFKLMKIS